MKPCIGTRLTTAGSHGPIGCASFFFPCARHEFTVCTRTILIRHLFPSWIVHQTKPLSFWICKDAWPRARDGESVAATSAASTEDERRRSPFEALTCETLPTQLKKVETNGSVFPPLPQIRKEATNPRQQ